LPPALCPPRRYRRFRRWLNGAAREAVAQEVRQAAEALQREAAILGATKREIADAAHLAIATVSSTVEAAVVRLAALIADADADDARQGSASLLEVALEKVAATLVDGASSLDAAGQRVAAAGESVIGQLATDAARGEAARSALSDVVANLTAAAVDLRLETFVLTGAAQQMSAAGTAATSAVSDVAVRAEMSASSLDTAGRTMNSASAGPPAALAATLLRLDEVSYQTETLLQQTEMLAEAVISGRAPGLPDLLADRTPVLLAGINVIAQRLRSVATALALVSDGVPVADRRSA
jgi:hypothetical protein